MKYRVVTISQTTASGGEELAADLSAVTGYRLLEKTIIDEVARKTGLTQEEVQRFDEQAYGGTLSTLLGRFMDLYPLKNFEGLWASKGKPTASSRPVLDLPPFSSPELAKKGVLDPDSFVELVRKIITEAADAGEVIIVGRGGQVILADRPATFHIRCTAPLSARAKTLGQKENIAEDQAAKIVENLDKRKRAFLKKMFAVDWDDPSLYHLTVNLGRISKQEAFDLIFSALK